MSQNKSIITIVLNCVICSVKWVIYMDYRQYPEGHDYRSYKDSYKDNNSFAWLEMWSLWNHIVNTILGYYWVVFLTSQIFCLLISEMDLITHSLQDWLIIKESEYKVSNILCNVAILKNCYEFLLVLLLFHLFILQILISAQLKGANPMGCHLCYFRKMLWDSISLRRDTVLSREFKSSSLYSSGIGD